MPLTDTSNRSLECLTRLIAAAFQANGFGALCTLLRVDGIRDAKWDPFEESQLAIDDLNWIYDRVSEARGESARRRVALLIYCQLVEMSAAHDMLVNLIQLAGGKPYSMWPLAHLRQRRKNGKVTPPSAKRKFQYIRSLAVERGQHDLVPLVDSFFNDDVRNAFSHSDYVFSKEAFRWTESGVPKGLALPELDLTLSNCFGFYSSLLSLHDKWLRDLATGRRFHKWPDYEVLELLIGDSGLVYGFSVHFSNGQKATFSRTSSGVEAHNMWFSRDGGVDFFVGSLDALEAVYKINGVQVDDWGALGEQR